MKLKAVLDRASIDSEGESTITLKIPLSYRNQALELLKLTEQVLLIEITPSNKPYYQEVTPVELWKES